MLHRDDEEKARLKAELRKRDVHDAAVVLATRHGAIDAQAVATIIAADLDKIEFDEHDKPENLVELVAALKRKHPSLFTRRPDGNAGAGQRDRTGGGDAAMNAWILNRLREGTRTI
jgi:hypothetical protein